MEQPLPSHARVVVIGGGVVGVSCLWHLARAGWFDALLLEKSELTAGSTWHAAGNVPTFSASWSIMQMQRYSAGLYRDLAARTGAVTYNVTGSVRLGHTRARRMEFARVVDMGRRQGMDLALLDPSEVRDAHPFCETHDLSGALWDPSDGDIDPAGLTQALATEARAMGARIARFCPATGARREGGEWVIDTPQGEVRAEIVVNAAGYRAAEVGAWFGRRVPMATMSHQYLVFDSVPAVEAWSRDAGRKLPLLRDVDTSYYLRQEKTGFNLGPYERACRVHWATPDDPMPEDFSFQLFPDDLDRLEPYIEDAMARVPVLAEGGLIRVINGPIPYTPDGNPLIGPMPGVPNAFEACVFTFGICQAGGAGKALAEWVTEGAPEHDLWSCDPRRFTGWEDDAYCGAKAAEVYGHEYAIHFPHHAWPAGRDRRTSPLHATLAAQGAQFGPANGWERALWFARPGDDTSEEAQRTWDRDGPWSGAVREECLAVRDAAGLLDLPGFSRFELSGAGAADWLAAQVAGRLPKPGRVTLGYFPDEAGRVLTEMSIAAHEGGAFTLITAAVAQGHDGGLLRDRLAPGLTLRDASAEVGTLILTGPAARAILAPLTDADMTRPWLTHQRATVAGRPAWVVRVSFAGELGWEIHASNPDLPAIHAALTEAGPPHGLRPFGMFALDSLRLEKGYRAWRADLSTEDTLREASLDRFIDWDHPFPGRDALRDATPTRRIVTLTVAPGDTDPPAMASVRAGEVFVGYVTSAGFGHRTGQCIALASVDAAHAAPGTRLTVDAFGEARAATVHDGPAVWDPTNARLRA